MHYLIDDLSYIERSLVFSKSADLIHQELRFD